MPGRNVAFSREQHDFKDNFLYIFSIDYPLYKQTAILESLVNKLVRLGFPVFRADEDFVCRTENGETKEFIQGSFILSSRQEKFRELLFRDIKKSTAPFIKCYAPIKVRATRINAPSIAIYNGTGNSLAPLTGFGRCLEQLGFRYQLITRNEILRGELDRFNLLIMPGGDEPWYGIVLGKEGNQIIRNFVHRGGGYLGACAGAYYASRKPVFYKADMPGYGLKEYPGPNPVEFLNILDFTCLNNIIWEDIKGTIPKAEEFFKHGSRDVGFDTCWYSDYLEVSQAYPFQIGSRPTIINRHKDHPVMYGLPKKFWQNYAGGPMMAPFGNCLSLAHFSTDIPEGKETFDPMKAKSLLLENASSIVQGFFGKGRGVAFSCHPEQSEETYLVVANAIHYLSNPGPERVVLPYTEPEREIYKAWEILRQKNYVISSIDGFQETLQRYSDHNQKLSAAAPEPLKGASDKLAQLMEQKISEILSNSRNIKLLLEIMPSNFEFALCPTDARQILRIGSGLGEIEAQLHDLEPEFKKAQNVLNKLIEMHNVEQKRLSFASEYFFLFMGKEDLLGSGGSGINRWAPGIGDDDCSGFLPILHKICERLCLIRELLEFAGRQKIGGEDERNWW